MTDEKKKKAEVENFSSSNATKNDCEEKIEKLNKKIQRISDELKKITILYAKVIEKTLIQENKKWWKRRKKLPTEKGPKEKKEKKKTNKSSETINPEHQYF